VAAAHQRYLSGPGTPRRLLEAYHSCQCTALFTQQLKQPLKPQDRDPLWAVAALLGVITYASSDATCPEEAWPLKAPEDTDLQWLRISEGKMAIWRLVDPRRPDSVFASMAHVYEHMGLQLPDSGADGLPPALARVCGLDAWSTPENNPYFTAAHVVSWLHSIPAGKTSAGDAMIFLARIQWPFKALLHGKDPAALLLLAWYYKVHLRPLWWVEARSRMEGEAICIYLRRFHNKEKDILDLLPDSVSSSPFGRSVERVLEL
jgi:hypothetical protein